MKKFLYLMLAVAVVLMVLYTYIGGFSAPKVDIATSETMYVAGQLFEGSVEDEAMGKAFQRAAEVLDKKELDGMLGNIYYNDPDKSGDSIRAFIGIILMDSVSTLPNGFTLRKIEGGKKVVHAEVEANVVLSPKKLYTAVFDYAKEQKLELEDFYIEWFPKDDLGVLEVPVKE
jgi:DNA gyrase inhibitor GyrI